MNASKILLIRQALECPQEYADFLARIGGKNPFGEPNFRLVWGQTRTRVIYGQADGGKCGAHVKFKYHGIPAWHLEQWKSPIEIGCASREDWYRDTWQPDVGLHLMGDFPSRGDYDSCPIALYTKNVVNKTLVIDAMPLNYRMLEFLVPVIQSERELSWQRRRAIVQDQEDKAKKERARIAEDIYRNGSPAFGGADFDRSVNRDRMVREMGAEHFPVSAEEVKRRMGTGFVQAA